eukprot:m.266572 g.266572  ORF g.266572 m.266572 type:complete len:69 (+) comp40502_c0_seq3:1-207(+)
MAGVFLVLAVGICVAFLVAILQRIVMKYNCLQLAENAFMKRRSQMNYSGPTVATGPIETTAGDSETAI